MNEIRTAVVTAYERFQTDSAAPVCLGPLDILSSASSGVTISLYSDLRAVEHIWRRFEPQADCTVFQQFDYLAACQKHVGARGKIRPAIVVLRRNGGVIAILPLAVSGGWVRRLTWLGQSLCDYLAPLLAPDFNRSVEPEQFAGLWREIRALMQRDPRFRHDLVDLRRMPDVVGSQKNPFLALPVTPNASNAHLASISGNWEDFYAAKRSGLKRRRDRNTRKRLGESGAVRMVTPLENADIVRTLETLIRQKSAALTRMGVADIFAKPGVRDFYLDLATDPRTRDLVHVSCLEIGPIMASVSLGLRFRSRYHYILASYDSGPISRFSPGAAHLRDLMVSAIEGGFREFDFTVGDESYKFDWADTETKLYDFLAAASWRGLPVALFARALSHSKRTIKQNPLLWRMAQRIRAASGRMRDSAPD